MSRTITIIETGLVPAELRDEHGSYPDMFERMLSASKPAEVETISVCKGDSLPDPDGVEAALITGSAHGVYEDHDWIAPLETFIRSLHRRGVPLVGVCFGHQLIAQAMGGVVRKSEKGWGIGRHVYAVNPDVTLIDRVALGITCSHQDQVVVPPPGATAWLSSGFTPHAGLIYDTGRVLTVQAHPEFTEDYARTRCEARRGHAPDDVVETGLASLSLPLDNAELGRLVTRFLEA